MTIRLLFFSLLRDVTGTDELELALPRERVRVRELLEILYERFDGLGEWDEKLLVAINCEYADGDDLIAAGDEVAIMPPVQGG